MASHMIKTGYGKVLGEIQNTPYSAGTPDTPPSKKKQRPPILVFSANLPPAMGGEMNPISPTSLQTPTPKNLLYVQQGSEIQYQPLGDHPIASGAFGDVWQAKRVTNTPEIPSSLLFAAIKEATPGHTLSELPIHRYLPSHPNVIDFFGVLGLHEKRAAFAWASGGSFVTIASKLSQHAAGDLVLLDDALRLLLNDICAGFVHMHAHGIIHLDVKPANMLVNDKGIGMVGDLGEAHAFGEPPVHNADGWQKIRHETLENHTPGTLFYASPEALGAARTAASAADVWSFGVLVHELLTGHLFLNTEKDTTTSVQISMMMHMRSEAQYPGSYAIHVANRLANTIPEELPSGPWLHSMLTRVFVLDPSQRPSMEALKSDPLLSQFTYDVPTLRGFIAASI